MTKAQTACLTAASTPNRAGLMICADGYYHLLHEVGQIRWTKRFSPKLIDNLIASGHLKQHGAYVVVPTKPGKLIASFQMPMNLAAIPTALHSNLFTTIRYGPLNRYHLCINGNNLEVWQTKS